MEFPALAVRSLHASKITWKRLKFCEVWTSYRQGEFQSAQPLILVSVLVSQDEKILRGFLGTRDALPFETLKTWVWRGFARVTVALQAAKSLWLEKHQRIFHIGLQADDQCSGKPGPQGSGERSRLSGLGKARQNRVQGTIVNGHTNLAGKQKSRRTSEVCYQKCGES